ncbi:MAG: YceI family protein, partial [Ahrensia sp.]
VGETDYEANGVLTIKGVEQPVVLPFSLVIEGDTATMSGQLVIDRMNFTVGAGSYENADTVGLAVTINVDLVAQRAEAAPTAPAS